MGKVAFQVYANEKQLVAVIFPENGGSSVVEERWELETLGLKCGEPKPQHTVPSNRLAGSEKTSLHIEIDYDDSKILVCPINKQGNKLRSYSLLYSFDDLNLSESELKEGEVTLSATREEPGLNKSSTWP
jgi:hypothetical protein